MIWLSRQINRVMEIIALVLLSVMFLVLVYSIACRQFGIGSTYWVEEFTNMSLFCITFVGSTIAYFRTEHIRIEVLDILLPKRFRVGLFIGIHLISIVFLFFLIYLGYKFSLVTMNLVSPSMGIPKGWVNLLLPLSAGIMILHAVRHILLLCFEPAKELESQEVINV